jgi:branched-chain amino acid aminotransferase
MDFKRLGSYKSLQQKNILILMAFACIDGRFLPALTASVPLSDRGLRFGDGAFETIAVHGGVPYQWKLHLTRLKKGLEAIGIKLPLSDTEHHALALLARNKVKEGFLRIMITRGSGSEGYLPTGRKPRIIIETLPRKAPPKSARITVSGHRKISPHALPAEAKLMQGLSSILARMEAAENHCLDALMLSAEGHIAETSSANIFWLKGKTLYTPVLTTGCVAGTTRAAILRLSPFPIREGKYKPAHLQGAEAAFLTNTNWQVLPVASIAPWKTAYQPAHPAIKELQALLKKDIRRHVAHGKKTLG